jgi:importin-9
MDEELVQVLANTLSSDQQVRQQAELALNHARTNAAFPISLANVAAQEAVDIPVRQGALTNLRIFIEKNWNPADAQDEPTIPISQETRDEIKRILVRITLSQEDKKKIKILARLGLTARLECACRDGCGL